MLYNSDVSTLLDGATDTTGQPLRPPPRWERMGKFVTDQIASEPLAGQPGKSSAWAAVVTSPTSCGACAGRSGSTSRRRRRTARRTTSATWRC